MLGRTVKRFLIAAIRFYQVCLSPLKMRCHCRFYPTCSQYTFDAVERYGVLIGSVLGALRLLRCNPLFPGGVDPVPDLKLKYKRIGPRPSGQEDGESGQA